MPRRIGTTDARYRRDACSRGTAGPSRACTTMHSSGKTSRHSRQRYTTAHAPPRRERTAQPRPPQKHATRSTPSYAARAQLTRPQLGAALNGTSVYALLRPTWHWEDHRLALRLTAIGLRDAVRPYRFRHANTSAGEIAAHQSLFYLRAADHVMFWYDAWERGCARLLALEQVTPSSLFFLREFCILASDRPTNLYLHKCSSARVAVNRPGRQNSPTRARAGRGVAAVGCRPGSDRQSALRDASKRAEVGRALLGPGPTQSAPRSRRDRAEIAPRSRAGIVCEMRRPHSPVHDLLF